MGQTAAWPTPMHALASSYHTHIQTLVHQSRETTALASTATHSLHERGILSPPCQIDQPLASAQQKRVIAKRSSSNWAWYLHTSSSPLDYRKTYPIHVAPAHKLNTQDSIGGYQIIAMLQPASLQRPSTGTQQQSQHQGNNKTMPKWQWIQIWQSRSKNDTMHGPSGSLGYVDQALIIWYRRFSDANHSPHC